jgi:class 3 adenylate cyclase
MVAWISLGLVTVGFTAVLILLGRRHRARERRLHEDKFLLAERALALLEQTETHEEQKFKLAEASVALLSRNEILDEARAQIQRLLHNVLPVPVAAELLATGKTTPACYESVSVLFADLVGFTQQAARLTPVELIGELNDIYTGFDRRALRNRCERIKTIGDAYLCVSGMPDHDPAHARHSVAMACDMIQFLEERNARSALQWQVRIGIHSGEVIGGVVGIHKYAYDIFGDTVNTAARMEAASAPMRITISEATFQLVGDEVSCTPRPPMEVKGKGTLRLYFVDPIAPGPATGPVHVRAPD